MHHPRLLGYPRAFFCCSTLQRLPDVMQTQHATLGEPLNPLQKEFVWLSTTPHPRPARKNHTLRLSQIRTPTMLSRCDRTTCASSAYKNT